MNICYLATTAHISKELDEAKGSAVHTYEIAKWLTKIGHKVVVVSEKFENDKDFQIVNGIDVYRLYRGVVASSETIKKSKFGFL